MSNENNNESINRVACGFHFVSLDGVYTCYARDACDACDACYTYTLTVLGYSVGFDWVVDPFVCGKGKGKII